MSLLLLKDYCVVGADETRDVKTTTLER